MGSPWPSPEQLREAKCSLGAAPLANDRWSALLFGAGRQVLESFRILSVLFPQKKGEICVCSQREIMYYSNLVLPPFHILEHFFYTSLKRSSIMGRRE